MRYRPAFGALSHNQIAIIGAAALVLALTMLVIFGRPLGGRAAETTLPAAKPSAVLTDRLRIPALGVDAPLGVQQVTKDGGLPRPPRAVDVVWYDFGLHPGLGGVPGASGNTILTGRVDSASSDGHTGVHYVGPAAFTDLELVRPGHQIEVTRGGQTLAYRVVSVEILNEEHANWRAVFATTPVEMLTLFNGSGKFNTHELDWADKTIVKAVRVLGQARRLDATADGRFLRGTGGTSDPLELAAAQPRKMAALYAQDPQTGEWLTFVPGAPSFINTLTGRLRPDMLVVGRTAQ